MPLKPGQRTSSTPRRRRAGTRRPRRRSRACARMRRCSVRRPRWTRKQSNGPGHGADRVLHEAHLLVELGVARRSTAPPTASECPPRYFVVECTTTSAPSSSGRWLAGVANVLSTATSASRLRATTPAMSTTLSSGLVGVSTQTRRVSSADARRPARRGRSGRPSCSAGPSASGPCRRAGRCRRRGRRAGRRGRRPRTAAVMTACVGGHARARTATRGRPRARRARVSSARARRVGRARVVVVLDELAAARLRVGRGLVDRGDDRAVGRVGLQAGVDGAGARSRRRSSGQRFEQVGARDDAGGAAVAR